MGGGGGSCLFVDAGRAPPPARFSESSGAVYLIEVLVQVVGGGFFSVVGVGVFEPS